MKSLKVLALKGCGHCKSVKEGLAASSILFEDVDADDNDELADSVEDIVVVDSYPIALIEERKHTTFVYITNDGAKLGPRRLGPNMLAIGCVDSDSLLKNIISNM